MAIKCLLAAAVCSALTPGALPDADLTPGTTRTTDKAVICTQHTAAVRNVTAAVKRKVFAAYAAAGYNVGYPRGGWCNTVQGCEVDHLISLELGGSNDLANLWPQPYVGRWNARQKDVLENKLHKMICTGVISVEGAQSAIATNWIGAWQAFVQPKTSPKASP